MPSGNALQVHFQVFVAQCALNSVDGGLLQFAAPVVSDALTVQQMRPMMAAV